MRLLPLVLFLLAVPVMAENFMIDPADVMDVLTEDWNDDGSFDKAVLVRGEEDADLYPYVSQPDGNTPLVGIARAVAWHGAMAGTLASLKQPPSGSSFYINSQNEAIGRNRWTSRLTVAIRDNRGLVAGYTYNSRDTLNLEYSFSCGLNLLTGKGVRNGMPFRSKDRRIDIADWSDDKLPAECLE